MGADCIGSPTFESLDMVETKSSDELVENGAAVEERMEGTNESANRFLLGSGCTEGGEKWNWSDLD